MSVIVGVIPPRAFELVRDRICEILADEISNQANLASDADLEEVIVWKERFIPFNQSEMPAVNVSFASGVLSGQTQKNTDGTYTYFIDVFTKALGDDDERGDTKATLKLHKIIGVCQGILENSRYRTLGFTPPFISHRHCENISISDPGRQDTANSIMGRISLIVKVPESMELVTPTLIGGNNTTVKLYSTDLGYFYSTGEDSSGGSFLLESGDEILTESGDNILLE